MKLLNQNVCLLAALLAAGCGVSNGTLPARFDPVSGDMVITYRQPLVFARSVPALSVAARDYVYVGPLEIQRNGVQKYYLWVGIASTVDRGLAGVRVVPAEKLRLTVAGETVDLPLIPWTEGEGTVPYDVAVPLQASLSTPLSYEDLNRIAAAVPGRIELFDQAGRAREFSHWRGEWAGWQSDESDSTVGFKVGVSAPSS